MVGKHGRCYAQSAALTLYGSNTLLLCCSSCCRYGLEFTDVSSAVAGCTFRVFAGALADGGCVKLIRVPEGKRISNSRLKPPKGDVVAEAVSAGEGFADNTCDPGLFQQCQPCSV